MKILNIEGNYLGILDIDYLDDMTVVDAVILSEAVTSLHSVNIGETGLDDVQINQLLSDIGSKQMGDLVLKNLDLHGIELGFVHHSDVNDVILSYAVINLHSVNIGNTGLTDEQLNQLFSTIASKQMGQLLLKVLDLHGSYLEGFGPADIISEAVMKLQSVNMNNCYLSTDQQETILSSIANKEGELLLKDLDLTGNQPGVDSGIMARVEGKLHRFP